MKRRLGLASLFVLPLFAVIVIACNGETLDLGGGEAGTSSETTTGDGGTAADQQVWTGYVENYKFASGTSSVRLTYTLAADGSLEGTARFGDAPLLRTPVTGDPDAVDGSVLHADYLEGFLYSLRQGTLAAERLQAAIAPLELYSAWCSAQVPQSQLPPTGTMFPPGFDPPPVLSAYSCEPAESYGGIGGEPCSVGLYDGGKADVDCTRSSLCHVPGAFCTCDAGGCAPRIESETADVIFDLQVQGDRADGTIVLQTRVPIHLVKM